MGRHYRNVEGDFIRRERRQERFEARREVVKTLKDHQIFKEFKEHQGCSGTSTCICWLCSGLRKHDNKEYHEYLLRNLTIGKSR